MFSFPLYHWHLEISSKCALACSRCPRTGEENKAKYVATQWNIGFFREVFSEQFLKEQVQCLLLCGGHGDPIYNSDFLEIAQYVKSVSPNTGLWIVTNGGHRTASWWTKLAGILKENDRVVFSLDGWDQDSNEKYRAGSDFQGSLEALQIIAQSKAEAHWSTIVFRFNQEQIPQIEALAKKSGADYFQITLSTKFGRPWYPSYQEDPLAPEQLFTSQHSVYKKGIRKLSSREAKVTPFMQTIYDRHNSINLSHKDRKIVPRCLIGEKGLYIDAQGYFYPCSWMSHPHDMPLLDGQKNPWLENHEKFNIRSRGLEAVLNDPYWSDFFQNMSTGNNAFYECTKKCSNACVNLVNRSNSRLL